MVHITEMPIKCPVAPLEFAFLADSYFKHKHLRDQVDITFATPLSGAFTKPKATNALQHLLDEKHIKIESDFAIESIDNENKTIVDYGGRVVPFDLLVTVPTNKKHSAMSDHNGDIKKMMIILSKATLENVYAAFVLANGARMEGIEAEMFFTFFGLEAIHKEKLEHLHIATVGNPAMHMPTLLGGLPGVEALATHMMKKEMERIDMPDVHEFLDILKASGVKLWACKLAMDMFHYKKEDLYDDVDGVITVGDFYKQGSGVGTHMLFI